MAKIVFIPRNNTTNNFIKMSRLLDFLETSKNRVEKLVEIEMAVKNGLITTEDAVELVIEFC